MRYYIVGLLAASALAVPASASHGSLHLRKLAVTGDPVPGAGPGVVFSGFESYLGGAPTVDGDGRVGFFAFLEGPDVDPVVNGTALFVAAPEGAVTMIVRAGDAAPGVGGGAVFNGFPEAFASLPPALDFGRAAFLGGISGGGVTGLDDEGLWFLDLDAGGSQPDLFLRRNQAAPGIAAGTTFTGLGMPNWDPAGAVMLRATINGPGVTSDSDETFWTTRAGALEMMLREGDQAPGAAPGVVVGHGHVGAPYSFPVVRFTDNLKFLVQANLHGAGTSSFNDEALFIDLDGELTMFLREGDPAPGAGPGVTFGGNSVYLAIYDHSLTFNELGQMTFSIRLGGSVPTTSALYSTHTGTLWPVGLPGDPAPGTNETFGLFSTPVLSDAGRLAFRAALSGAGEYPPLGVWWDQPNEPGVYQPLALPGQMLPDEPGTVVVGINWIRGFTPDGVIALQGSVERDGAVAGAVLLADDTGALHLVLAAGDELDVAGDGSDVRTVQSIVSGLLSESGVVAMLVRFTDGSSAHYAASFDSCPADFDDDGAVGITDFLSLLGAWGPNPGHAADLDGDGVVGIIDFLSLLGAWGPCP